MMATEIKVPALGESVTSATVARWLRQAGEAVAVDEPLVELETDKVTVEVNAPVAGVLSAISADAGTEVEVGATLGVMEAGASAPAGPGAQSAPAPHPAPPPGYNPSAAPARAQSYQFAFKFGGSGALGILIERKRLDGPWVK